MFINIILLQVQYLLLWICLLRVPQLCHRGLQLLPHPSLPPLQVPGLWIPGEGSTVCNSLRIISFQFRNCKTIIVKQPCTVKVPLSRESLICDDLLSSPGSLVTVRATAPECRLPGTLRYIYNVIMVNCAAAGP